RRKNDENSAGPCDEQPIPNAAGMRGLVSRLAAVQARLDVVGGNAVALAFALRRFFPTRLLFSGSRRKSNRANPQHHEQRAANNLQVSGRAAAMQFTKYEDAPEQSPELIGIGERDTAADADVFGGVLLKEIADNPDKAAKHQPKNHAARAEQFLPERCQTGVANGERGNHAHFT